MQPLLINLNIHSRKNT